MSNLSLLVFEAMFKPRLETILKDIIVLSEVAELADETNRFASGNKEEKLQRSPSNVNILGTNFNWARDRLLSGDGPIIVADGSEFNDEITENSDLPEDDGSQWDEIRSVDVRKNSTGSLDVKDLLDKVGSISVLLASDKFFI